MVVMALFGIDVISWNHSCFSASPPSPMPKSINGVKCMLKAEPPLSQLYFKGNPVWQDD